MADEELITKEELLERVQRSRAALEETIKSLSDEQLEAREEGGWAVTDHLAHLAAWERGVAEFLRGRSRAVGMGLTEEAWGQSMDEVNEVLYRQNAALSAAQARQMYEEAHEQMLDALEDLDDEGLLQTHANFLPDGEHPDSSERLLLETIRANTYEHYDEHAEYIREKLRQS